MTIVRVILTVVIIVTLVPTHMLCALTHGRSPLKYLRVPGGLSPLLSPPLHFLGLQLCTSVLASGAFCLRCGRCICDHSRRLALSYLPSLADCLSRVPNVLCSLEPILTIRPYCSTQRGLSSFLRFLVILCFGDTRAAFLCPHAVPLALQQKGSFAFSIMAFSSLGPGPSPDVLAGDGSVQPLLTEPGPLLPFDQLLLEAPNPSRIDMTDSPSPKFTRYTLRCLNLASGYQSKK